MKLLHDGVKIRCISYPTQKFYFLSIVFLISAHAIHSQPYSNLYSISRESRPNTILNLVSHLETQSTPNIELKTQTPTTQLSQS